MPCAFSIRIGFACDFFCPFWADSRASATESASMILRIEDVMAGTKPKERAGKPPGEMPESSWNSEFLSRQKNGKVGK